MYELVPLPVSSGVSKVSITVFPRLIWKDSVPRREPLCFVIRRRRFAPVQLSTEIVTFPWTCEFVLMSVAVIM